ncbi:MAG TPA: hypothetical protein VHR66_20850 [Gemmataceae bacterium]|jgi:hypothetical protein|nr:hypothetical protein [Gemmataceae bacterium]
MSRTLLVLLIVAPLATAAPTAQVADGKIVVTGLLSTKAMTVVVAEGTDADVAARPPVTGEWSSEDGKIIFTPKYPLKAGVKYRVTGGGEKFEVHVPKIAEKLPTLTHIYPTAAELPENVLRFYVEFDRPMPRGDVYKYVAVLKENGDKIAQPFLEIDDELWNADQTRLTLLIDPGRIKKEVKPRIDLGPVFEQGKKYRLVVSGKWPTLSGEPLGKDVSKSITVGAAVTEALDPKVWRVTSPSDPKQTLTVSFGRPMDLPVLTRNLSVIGPDGQAVVGTWQPTDQDRGWSFRPAAHWSPGEYAVRAEAVLEDVCGNRVGRAFEVDLLKPAPKPIKAQALDIPFVVGR